MRRNGYLWTSSVNLDTAVRFPDPDFLLECKISAIWRRFPLIAVWFPDPDFLFECKISAIWRRFPLIAVSFPDPDFVFECKISAIWWRLPLIFAFYILNVSRISASGLFDLLTCKAYHTHWPHVDNSHQVWSWYDHPLPSYICLLIRYVTWWPWPFDLEQLS